MFVVIDTSAINRHRDLQAPKMQLLIEVLSHVEGTLVLPQVVIQELSRHAEEDLADACKAVRKGVGNINKLSSADYHLPCPELPDPVTLRKEVESRLTLEVLAVGGEAPSPNVVSVKALLERAVAKRKPFNGDGKKGMKDAILWEHVVEVARRGKGKVVLITRDTKDFLERSKLHRDLVHDLEAAGVDPATVVIETDLRAFVEREAKSHLSRRFDLEESLRDGTDTKLSIVDVVDQHSNVIEATINDDFWHASEDIIYTILDELPGRRTSIRFVEALFEGTVDEVESVRVFQLEDNKVFVELLCNLEVRFTVESDAHVFVKDDMDDIRRRDSLWQTVSVAVEFVWNPSANKVEKFQCTW